MNSPLSQMRRIILRIIAAFMMVEQLILHCVNTRMDPRKVTHVLRYHVSILITPFTKVSPLSPLRDTQLILNMHLTPLGSTTNLRVIVKRSRLF